MLFRSSENMFDIFSVASFIFGFSDSIDSKNKFDVFRISDNFVREKGPRIDFKLEKDENGELFLNYYRALHSGMSFKLAGIDNETLAFGYLDSLAEFLANLAKDMHTNYSIDSLYIFGDALTQKRFLDRLIHYLPKNIEANFPKSGLVDFN